MTLSCGKLPVKLEIEDSLEEEHKLLNNWLRFFLVKFVVEAFQSFQEVLNFNFFYLIFWFRENIRNCEKIVKLPQI